jgi:hypothetical protein
MLQRVHRMSPLGYIYSEETQLWSIEQADVFCPLLLVLVSDNQYREGCHLGNEKPLENLPGILEFIKKGF